MPHPIEEIPDDDLVYYRIHHSLLVKGELHYNCFRKQGESMSTDWNKYSDAETSLKRKLKNVGFNAIVSGNVGEIREIREPNQNALHVTHDPMNPPPEDNRSHTGVTGLHDKGELKISVRKKLMKVFKNIDIKFDGLIKIGERKADSFRGKIYSGNNEFKLTSTKYDDLLEFIRFGITENFITVIIDDDKSSILHSGNVELNENVIVVLNSNNNLTDGKPFIKSDQYKHCLWDRDLNEEKLIVKLYELKSLPL